jgi:hypothetical protein
LVGVSHTPRRRRYLPKHWFVLARPLLRYSISREAFVLRAVGDSVGPVLRPERRRGRASSFAGVERRRAKATS